MAHPYAKHAEDKAGKARAAQLTKGYKTGGRVSSVASPIAKKSGGSVSGDMKVAGKASGGRLDKFARGGRTGKKGSQTKINIIVAPQVPPADREAAPAVPGVLPPPGGGLPPPPKGPMGPPMMPPPGPAAGLPKGPMMNRGGKVPMKAGAETGVGRLEKKKAYGLKPRGAKG